MTPEYETIMRMWLEAQRPLEEIRPELDLGFRFEGQSLFIYEIRPVWNNPGSLMEEPNIKATYVKSTGKWKVYWMRADLKWHRYDPLMEADSLEQVLSEYDADPMFCFKG